MFQEAKNVKLKRVSRQPIFISVDSEVPFFNLLSGKYNFHGIKNNAAAYVRNGGKLESFDGHPYYLSHYPGNWVFQDSENYKKNKGRFWIRLLTEGYNYDRW